MPELAIQHTLDFITFECGECGVTFGMTRYYNEQRRLDGATFYCLNGHQRVYRETRLQKLEKELEAERRRTAFEKSRREDAERESRARLGQMTKLQNRIRKGVCPHCQRTFTNVARHMQAKHAECEK